MSVNTYLNGLAAALVLDENEKDKINTSISTLSTRLELDMGYKLKEQFVFGSYTRKTILPRSSDTKSDIDYLVVFKNEENYKPQTFLNYLRDFTKKYYSSSEIHQSYPTIVLELNHIKFELVPAVTSTFGEYKIPSPSSDYNDWMYTSPLEFNKKLNDKHQFNNYKIKPMIRLIKQWNISNGRIFNSSYLLENDLIEFFYINNANLKDVLYSAIENLYLKYYWNFNMSETKRNKLKKAKEIVDSTKDYEDRDLNFLAEDEIRKLFT
ncbi:nucleotidyltransferase [Bacillus atrophaeus]|uniref:SMODS domain-containing nucleotidyltransferase n=1 Tax=Bacillus atrophaeus TaxID=1452 RepID=UPI0022817E01|nr:nucleotidyltransferase domain-containing protein [Bacillus atrophaeus]MCY8807027.1 nucleotidyltransferase [Bacillus atrophaeus]